MSLTVITGEEVFDALGSIAIGLLLGVIAIVLAIEMKSLLIGEAAVPEDEDAIVRALDDSPEVARVIHLRTLHLGPDELLVAVKFEPAAGSLDEIGATIDDLEVRIRDAVPERAAHLPRARPVPIVRGRRHRQPAHDQEDADAADHQG